MYPALLEVSESIAAHRDLPALFHDLSIRLPRLVQFDSLWLVLHDPEHNRMRLHILEVRSRVEIDVIDRSIEDSPSGLVWRTQQVLLVPNLEGEARFPGAFQLLRENHVRSCCILPLTTAHRRLGALGFGSERPNAYESTDVDFLAQVATQVALAVDNAISHQEAQALQSQLAQERDRLRLLLDLHNSAVPNLELRELLRTISAGVRRVMQCDYASVALPEAQGGGLRVYARDFSQPRENLVEEIVVPYQGTPAGQVFETGELLLLERVELERFDPAINPSLAEGFASACFLPLSARKRILGTLNVASLRDQAFTRADVDFLRQVSSQVALALENALDYHRIAESRERLAEEKLYLREEIRAEHNFEDIIGASPALKRVLKQVETVAPTDSTVLILGETGTGKELVARAIHNLSARREHTFVKVNCAAIPLGLLESELFGHEKGAFTGAIERKLGRFELAHQGTLFLDELGDIPLELQPKLLRVLQEQEFERLGSTRTIRVNVRVVAATSRNLSLMVDRREFRSDLYYRLNIFPLTVPPLRDRVSDIPLLVEYFAARYGERMSRKIDRVDRDTMDRLVTYHWPGNIRELQNVIERGVILAEGGVLRIDPSVLGAAPPSLAAADIGVLEQQEKELIEAALAETKGRVSGPNGAAVRLRLPPSTLESKIRALRINKYQFRARTP